MEAWENKRSELLALLLVKIAAHLGISKGGMVVSGSTYLRNSGIRGTFVQR
jgi:hypothetical protein